MALLLTLCGLLAPERAPAAGTWTQVTNLAPSPIIDIELLSDGTVIGVGYSKNWYRLTPDTNGSYANGTWSAITPAFKQHTYSSSQLLRDGRFYIGGSEYGDGGARVKLRNASPNRKNKLSGHRKKNFLPLNQRRQMVRLGVP